MLHNLCRPAITGCLLINEAMCLPLSSPINCVRKLCCSCCTCLVCRLVKLASVECQLTQLTGTMPSKQCSAGC